MSNETRCGCGHIWSPMGWQARTRNVQCPRCGGWNQAGATHPLYEAGGPRCTKSTLHGTRCRNKGSVGDHGRPYCPRHAPVAASSRNEAP